MRGPRAKIKKKKVGREKRERTRKNKRVTIDVAAASEMGGYIGIWIPFMGW